MSDGLVVASNRGPVSWRRAGGRLVPRRGFGGLVTALGGALQDEPGTWVSVALSDEDGEIARAYDGKPFDVDTEEGRFRLRLLDVGERFDPYYNEVSNRLLWFTLHGIWGAPYEPSGIGWQDRWDAYVTVNADVALAVADSGADAEEIHVHDYHLCVTSRFIRDALPRVPILHYLHTPWTGIDVLHRLPDRVVEEVLRGLLAADVVAFSSPRWAKAFRRCAADLLDAHVDATGVELDGRRTVVADFVLGADARALAESAARGEVAEAGRGLDDELAGRKLLLRVDRTDISKNIVRGLQAYELLLERYPQHRGRVWHYAHLNPSRQGVLEYREYLAECEATATRIRERFGEECLTVMIGDDYARAVAALQRYDVLLANPVMDGTNLVAKEGPVLNERDGVLVLSDRAGASLVLADGALLVNPYDVEHQVEALHAALTMPPAERAARSQRLRQAAVLGPPEAWLAAQRRALRDVAASR